MAEIGSWNGHQFIVSPTLIRGFTNLSISGASNTETSTSAEQDFMTRKSGKPVEITLTVELHACTGCDVRGESLALVKQARSGAKDFLYVGQQKLVTCQLMLTKADVNEIVLAPNGKMVSAKVALTLGQASMNDGSMPAVSTPSGGEGGSGGGGGSSGGGSGKASTKSNIDISKLTIGTVIGTVAGVGLAASSTNSIVQKAVASANAVVSAAKSASKKLTR